MIALELPLRTVSESNAHVHWRIRQKRAKAHREGTYVALCCLRAAPGLLLSQHGRLVVTLTRLAPRALDDDNLQGALKHVRDGVADALGIDDRDARIAWRYGQAKGPRPGHYAVRVVIAPATLVRESA